MLTRLVLFTLPLIVSSAFAQTPTPVRPAQATACQIFRSFHENQETPNAPTLGLVRELSTVARREGSRLPPALKPHELRILQMTQLMTSETALTPQESVIKFFDLERNSGLDGNITYFEVKNRITHKATRLAVVTHLPGENEYGAIFRIIPSTGNDVYAYLIGVIGDSDISCLEESL